MNRSDSPPRRGPRGHFRALLGLAVTAALITACAAGQPTQVQNVEQRAQQRWDALLAGDFEKAYGFYSPGYRSSHSRVDFELAIRSHRVAWTAAKVQESQCDGDACTVMTKIGYRVGSPVPGVPKWESERRMEERWIRTQGQWWFVPES